MVVGTYHIFLTILLPSLDVFLSKTAGLQLGQKPARVADKDMEQDLVKCLKVGSTLLVQSTI